MVPREPRLASTDHSPNAHSTRRVAGARCYARRWILLALVGLALGCWQTPDTPTASTVKAALRPVALVPAAQGDHGAEDAMPALPLGEAPPPPGTHFVDVAHATTRLQATYSPSQYRLPVAAWPPMAYRHEREMRVRWWALAWCSHDESAHVRLHEGVISFVRHMGPPMHCPPHLTAYETTFPPGNDAVRGLRGPSGGVQALPSVLPAEAPRRAPRRDSSLAVPDIYSE